MCEIAPIDIPKYSGARNENPQHFTYKFRILCDLCKWPDKVALAYLSEALEGNARLWYRIHRKEFENIPLEQVLHSLESAFDTPYSRLIARQELDKRLQQEGESVRTYSYDIYELGTRAGLSDRDIGEKLFQGFIRDIKEKVLLLVCCDTEELYTLTYDKVVQYGLRAETLLYEIQFYCKDEKRSIPCESNTGPQQSYSENHQSQVIRELQSAIMKLENEISVLKKENEDIRNNHQESSCEGGGRRICRGKPKGPCPICEDPNNIHWKFDCPLIELAKQFRHNTQTFQVIPAH